MVTKRFESILYLMSNMMVGNVLELFLMVTLLRSQLYLFTLMFSPCMVYVLASSLMNSMVYELGVLISVVPTFVKRHLRKYALKMVPNLVHWLEIF